MPEITDADQERAWEALKPHLGLHDGYTTIASIAARKAFATALAEQREKFRPFCERIQQAAMDRGGLDQGVEVDSATFVVQALEAAEAERDEYKEQAEAADTGHKNAIEALDKNWVTHQEVVASRKRAEAAEAERDMVRAALAELMVWVRNWDVPFLEDDEWPGTQARVETALGEGK